MGQRVQVSINAFPRSKLRVGCIACITIASQITIASPFALRCKNTRNIGYVKRTYLQYLAIQIELRLQVVQEIQPD